MVDKAPQSLEDACAVFLEWMDQQVVSAGRGDGIDRLEVAPSGTFWLGRIASEDEVRNGASVDERSERLDPCAIGIRIRPAKRPPWSITATARVRAWVQDPPDGPDPERRWWRTAQVEQVVRMVVDASGGTAGREQLTRALSAVGADGLSAEVRVDVEDWHETTELVVQLVNTSPQKVNGLSDTHLYEAQLEIADIETMPFQLEALPDSFRYNREIPAYGINVGVNQTPGGGLYTTDTVSVQTTRPGYWNSQQAPPDLSFAKLAKDPLPELGA